MNKPYVNAEAILGMFHSTVEEMPRNPGAAKSLPWANHVPCAHARYAECQRPEWCCPCDALLWQAQAE